MSSACLYHTYPFYCALAFEVTVPKHRPGKVHEIMELAATLVDARGQVPTLFGQFHSYVRPQVVPAIAEDVTARTGFTQAMADMSRPFPVVLEEFCCYLVDKGVISERDVDLLASGTTMWHRAGAREGGSYRKHDRAGRPYARGARGPSDKLTPSGRFGGRVSDDRWRARRAARAAMGEPEMLVVASGDWGIRDVLAAQCQLSGVATPLFLSRAYCNVKEAFAQHGAYTGVAGTVSSGSLGLNQITSFLRLPCSTTTYDELGVPRGLFNADALAQVLARMLHDKVDLPLTHLRPPGPPRRGEPATSVATWRDAEEGAGGYFQSLAAGWRPADVSSPDAAWYKTKPAAAPLGALHVHGNSPCDSSSNTGGGSTMPGDAPLSSRDSSAPRGESSFVGAGSASNGVAPPHASIGSTHTVTGSGREPARRPAAPSDDWEHQWSRLLQRSALQASGGGAPAPPSASEAAAGYLDIAYLTDKRFFTEGKLSLTSVLARAASAGVRDVVTLGTGLSSTHQALELAHHVRGTGQDTPTSSCVRMRLSRTDFLALYPGLPLPRLWATAGIHPTFAEHCTDAAMGALERLLRAHTPLVAAIGECGLDFADVPGDLAAATVEEPAEAVYRRVTGHVAHMASLQRKQVVVLEQQVALAQRWRKPLVLWGGGHMQEGEDDRAAANRKHASARQHEVLMDALIRHKAWLLQGNAMVHGFVGTPDQVDDLVSLGVYIGLSPALCNVAGEAYYVSASSGAHGTAHDGSSSQSGVLQPEAGTRTTATTLPRDSISGLVPTPAPPVRLPAAARVASYVREVARRVPLDRLVISTGAPGAVLRSMRPLAPVNEPLFLADVSDELLRLSGAVHGRSRSELLRASAQNARGFFAMGTGLGG